MKSIIVHAPAEFMWPGFSNFPESNRICRKTQPETLLETGQHCDEDVIANSGPKCAFHCALILHTVILK